MFQLLSHLRKIDWILMVLVLGLTLLQVYCTMTMMDYISNITQAIQYLNYHNQPQLLFGDSYAMVSSLVPEGMEFWVFVKSMLPQISQQVAQTSSLSADAVSAMLSSIADASIGDVWFNGGMMLLLALGMVGCQAVISVLASYVSASLATTIRRKMNEKVSSFSLKEINHFSIASLITRSTNDVQMYQMTVLTALRMFFAAPVTAIWAVCKINSVDWTLMLPTLVGIVLLVVGLLLLLVWVLPKFRLAQKLLDKVNGQSRENVSGIRVVHAYNAETYQEEKFAQTNDELTKTQLFTGRCLALLSPFVTIVMNVVSLLVYWVGSLLINQSQTDYPQVLSMMMLSTQVIMAFMMLLMMFVMLPRAQVSAKRIVEVLKTENSIVDPAEEKPLVEHGMIEFRDVSFRYPDGDNMVIDHISFKANKGETVAFIGATGCGKTTIINLIPRLYDVTSGEVLIDGVNVKDLKQATLCRLIGYVPQKGLLFSGTVASNIAFGNDHMTQEEIVGAAKVAEADEFISQMPDQYDAKIAQGGTNVSGGQRQRLCIARAVATHPEFFIFDDSFSALDFKTDRKVRDNLKSAAKDATKLIVAQRIGTIMDADHIVVLSDGRQVGYGTHRELLQSCEVYRGIALSQLSQEELGL